VLEPKAAHQVVGILAEAVETKKRQRIASRAGGPEKQCSAESQRFCMVSFAIWRFSPPSYMPSAL
jgi:hypothetical protein